MASREECVKTLNKFYRTQDLNVAVILLEYLCDVKETSKKKQVMEVVGTNPPLLGSLMPNIVRELEIAFILNKVTDKNNNLILFF